MQHHQKKSEVLLRSAEQLQHEKQKVAEGFQLLRRLLLMKSRPQCLKADALSAEILQFNPEIPTLWNIRRQILRNKWLTTVAPPSNCSTNNANSGEISDSYPTNRQHPSLLNEPSTDSQRRRSSPTNADETERCSETQLASVTQSYLNELELTAKALLKLPKGFGIWYHRRWIISDIINNKLADHKLLHKELQLCAHFLNLDCRNFHCWLHRSFICALLSQSNPHTESEPSANVNAINLEFTRKMIDKNFSNYSAWHIRSNLPPEMVPIHTELEWIRQGVFTEPDDQSLWQYYDWLLFSRGCTQPKLLCCALFPLGEGNSFYLYFSDACSIDSESSISVFAGSQKMLGLTGSWQAFTPSLTARSNGKNERIHIGDRLPIARVWRFEKLNIQPTSDPVCSAGREMAENGFQVVLDLSMRSYKQISTKIDTLSGITRHCESREMWVGTISRADFERMVAADGCAVRQPVSFCLFRMRGASASKLEYGEGEVLRMDAECEDELGVGMNADILKDEMKVIDELIELEPDCKYPRLMKCRILEKLRDHEPHFTAIQKQYQRLAQLDPPRAAFYLERRLLSAVQWHIQNWKAQGDDLTTLSLSHLEIYKINYPILISPDLIKLQSIDLSHNKLNNKSIAEWSIPYLASLTTLNLSHNQLTSLVDVLKSLQHLEFIQSIDLSHNPLQPLPQNYSPANDSPLTSTAIPTSVKSIYINDTPLASQLRQKRDIFNFPNFIISFGSSTNDAKLLRSN